MCRYCTSLDPSASVKIVCYIHVMPRVNMHLIMSLMIRSHDQQRKTTGIQHGGCKQSSGIIVELSKKSSLFIIDILV